MSPGVPLGGEEKVNVQESSFVDQIQSFREFYKIPGHSKQDPSNHLKKSSETLKSITSAHNPRRQAKDSLRFKQEPLEGGVVVLATFWDGRSN